MILNETLTSHMTEINRCFSENTMELLHAYILHHYIE